MNAPVEHHYGVLVDMDNDNLGKYNCHFYTPANNRLEIVGSKYRPAYKKMPSLFNAESYLNMGELVFGLVSFTKTQVYLSEAYTEEEFKNLVSTDQYKELVDSFAAYLQSNLEKIQQKKINYSVLKKEKDDYLKRGYIEYIFGPLDNEYRFLSQDDRGKVVHLKAPDNRYYERIVWIDSYLEWNKALYTTEKLVERFTGDLM
jgi:hypothetical protein